MLKCQQQSAEQRLINILLGGDELLGNNFICFELLQNDSIGVTQSM